MKRTVLHYSCVESIFPASILTTMMKRRSQRAQTTRTMMEEAAAAQRVRAFGHSGRANASASASRDSACSRSSATAASLSVRALSWVNAIRNVLASCLLPGPDKERFFAHRTILAARSPVFRVRASFCPAVATSLR